MALALCLAMALAMEMALAMAMALALCLAMALAMEMALAMAMALALALALEMALALAMAMALALALPMALALAMAMAMALAMALALVMALALPMVVVRKKRMKLYYDNVWAALYMRDVFGVKFEVENDHKKTTPLERLPVYSDGSLESAIDDINYEHGDCKIYVAEESLGVFYPKNKSSAMLMPKREE